ncbi:uncharacterized protein LOC143144908 [Ptiloglossa arizonensis]|uniref:uncharacterized protein LOC143144908 n=1 Tax=Ptiloglossa arizonensis TaxID=3350558 RepID=UPI003FA0AC26
MKTWTKKDDFEILYNHFPRTSIKPRFPREQCSKNHRIKFSFQEKSIHRFEKAMDTFCRKIVLQIPDIIIDLAKCKFSSINMLTKSEEQAKIKPNTKTETVICGIRSAGPKYKLKTLVGYHDHCISKYRNPAYTFGKRFPILQGCEGVGPKYLPKIPKQEGFSFGLVGKTFDTSCGPGPKYILPVPKSPAFSIKYRTKYRSSCGVPGPYNVKLPPDGQAFSMGHRIAALKHCSTPGPSSYSVHLVTPRAPAYTIAGKQEAKIVCDSPGPKYLPKPPKPIPMFSFGSKHNECALPYIVECDDQC